MSLAKRIRTLCANLQNGKATRAQFSALWAHADRHPMAYTFLSETEMRLLGVLSGVSPDMLPR